MTLTTDFEQRLDAHLTTLNEPAKLAFLHAQYETWQERFRNFCQRPRPSAPGDIQPTATDYVLTIGAVEKRLQAVLA